METVSIKELRNRYGALLDIVQNNKKCLVTVTRDGRPWVVLRSPLDYTPDRLNAMGRETGRTVRENLALVLGTVHYQKKPLLILRKGVMSACVFPPEEE